MSERTTVDKILMDRIDRDDTVDDRIKAAIRAHIQKVTGTLGKRMAHTIDIQALALAQMLNELAWQGIGQMSVVVEQIGTESAMDRAVEALELATSDSPPLRKDGQPKTAGGVFLMLTKKDYWRAMKAKTKAGKLARAVGNPLTPAPHSHIKNSAEDV